MGCTFHFAIVSVHNRVIKKHPIEFGCKGKKKLISAFTKMDNHFTKTDKMTFFSVFVGFFLFFFGKTGKNRKKKQQRIQQIKKRQDLRCFFYSLVLQGVRGQINVATRRDTRE